MRATLFGKKGGTRRRAFQAFRLGLVIAPDVHKNQHPGQTGLSKLFVAAENTLSFGKRLNMSTQPFN